MGAEREAGKQLREARQRGGERKRLPKGEGQREPRDEGVAGGRALEGASAEDEDPWRGALRGSAGGEGLGAEGTLDEETARGSSEAEGRMGKRGPEGKGRPH